MRALLAPLGALLVLAAFADAVVTTLAAGRGGGPLTDRIDRWVLTLLQAVGAKRWSLLRPYAGMLVLLATVLLWVALLWTGWTLVFSSSDGAVVSSSDGSPASVAGRIYYAGFVVFTLGVGDLTPGGGTWQVLTALATFLGLFLITLSITYLVSVVSAAVGRRALARTISVSGSSGVDIVRLHQAGDGLTGHFDTLTTSLCSEVLRTTQQHLAYPVLHSFLAAEPESSAPCGLAALDDALLLASAGLAEPARPGRDALTRLRRALETYGDTVTAAVPHEASTPPLPPLEPLRAMGLSTVSDEEFARAAAEHEKRRHRLAQLVAADGWDWPTYDARTPAA